MRLHFSKSMCLALVIMALPCSARQHATSRNKAMDRGYVTALATANRFLNAWQTGDLETGMLLLSDQVRRSQTAESVERVFSREPNRAFEISHGKCDHGAFRFPVVMLSGDTAHLHRKFSEIVLINTGKNDWVVNQLP